MKNNFLQRMNKWGIFDLGGVRKMSGECWGNVGRGLAWNFFTRVGGRSGEMKSNHAIITRLSRNNHLMLLRGIRYAAMLLTVLMVGTGQMWAADFDITLDQFRTTPISGLVKIDDSNLSLSGGALQLSSGNANFVVSTTNANYKIKKIVFTTAKADIKYGGESISDNTFSPETPATSFTLNLAASGGTAKITQMVVTLTTSTSETLEALVATAITDGVYTTGSSVITLSTEGGSVNTSSGQEYINLAKSKNTRSLTIATGSSYNIKFIALAFYDAIFSKTISASTGTYTAASYLWTPGATPTNSVTLTFATGNSEGAKIRRVIVGYESSGNTLQYNANGGTGTMANTVGTGTVTLRTNTYTKSGCTFQGWATSQDNANAGTVAYADGASYTLSADATLYAVWKLNKPEISCENNVVTMTEPASATVYYTTTTDGSKPSVPTSSNTAYNSSSKPTITQNTMFAAIAIKENHVSSDTAILACTYYAPCGATVPGDISKGTASGGTGTITLTAAGDPEDGDTWYWQSAADGTATNLGDGATKDVSAAGTYYIRSYNTAGDCWSSAKSVTVAAADLLTAISPSLSYSSSVIVENTLSPTLSGNDGSGSVTYALNDVSPEGSLTINESTGVVTAVTVGGTATVTATIAANGNYAGNTATSGTITVIANPLGTHTITWTMNVGKTTYSALASSVNPTSAYITATQEPTAGSSVTKDTGGSGQSDRTIKVTGDNEGDSRGANSYVEFAFSIADGYQFTPSAVSVKVANITTAKKYDLVLSDASGSKEYTFTSSSTDGTVETASWSSISDLVLTGNCKLRVYGYYASGTDGHRFGTPIVITGTVAIIPYTLTYDANGGTGTMENTTGTGTVTLRTNTYTKSGCTFQGWATSQDNANAGTVAYADGATDYSLSADATLYAVWKLNTPTISCENNVVTITVPGSSTVYYTTDGSTTPTSSSTAYDPSNKPKIAATTTFKAIAILANHVSSAVATQECVYVAPTTKRIYMEAANGWNNSTPYFYVKSWGSKEESVLMTQVSDCESNVFYADIPYGNNNVLFTRQSTNSGIKYKDEDGNYNQSVDIDCSSYDKFTFNGTWDKNSTGKSDFNYGTYSTPTYSVTYNKNGDGAGNDGDVTGSVPVDSNSPYSCGDDVTVLGNTGSLALAGYSFNGWNTAAGGGGDPYSADDTYEDIAANVTLYAQWTQEKPTSVSISGTWRYFPGQTVSLTATPTGGTGDFTYQWQKYKGSAWADLANGTDATDGGTFSGVGTANLQISGCTKSNSGSYRCVVSKAGGETASDGYGVHIYTLEGNYDGSDWVSNNITLSSGTVGTVELTLEAGRLYKFKIKDNYNNACFGNAGYMLKSVSSWACPKDGADIRLFTGAAGTYTFTVDIDHTNYGTPEVQVSVDYPSVTHPVAGYVYFAKGDYTWANIAAHWWYWDGETSTNFVAWGSNPWLTQSVEICGTTYYYMPKLEGYNRVIFHNAEGDGQTSDITVDASSSGRYIVGNSTEWTAFSTYTITFAENEGTGTMSDINGICKDADQALTANAFTKAGYAFSCWHANVDVTVGESTITAGGDIADGATLKGISSDIELTAQWTKLNTITYNANGGSCATSSATQESAGEELTLPTATRDGYTFEGWYNAGTKIGDAGDTYAPTADTTLYAHWLDGTEGKVFSYKDGNYGDKFQAFDLSWISDNGTEKDKTYTDAVTGVQFVVTKGAWDDKRSQTASEISLMTKFVRGTTAASVVIPAGKIATVKILYGAYQTARKLTVGGNEQDAPNAAFVDSHTNATLLSSDMTEVTLTNQTGTLILGSSEGNVYIARVSAVITGYQTLTFNATTNGNWNTASNWSPACVPTIDHDVVIAKPVTVDITSAQAKSVVIYNNGDDQTGKLTIPAGNALVVASTIQKTTNGSDYSATTHDDILIRTDYSGNGALICGAASTTTEAQYYFYSKSYKYNSWFVNQYVGIPFAECDAWDYYGLNIYEYDADNDSWMKPESSTLKSFTCYDLINKYNGAAGSYYLNGTLNLPGTASGQHEFECGWRDSGTSIDGESGHKDYLFANSWTAPISIAALSASDCSGDEGADLVHTIYIFNAGFENAEKEIGASAGTWSTFPFASSSYMANAVIPATQAFMITSKKGSSGATLTVKYKDHVYDPAIANRSVNTFPTRAPRRAQAGSELSKIRIMVRRDSTLADQLYLFEREDFTNEFDNGWDGTKVFGEAFAPQLYTKRGNANLAVDAVPDMEGTVVGFRKGSDDMMYKLTFEYNGDKMWYLNDLKTHQSTLISPENTYLFTAENSDAEARFVISGSPIAEVPTGVDGVSGQMPEVRKVMIDGILYIIRGGCVYNVTGKRVTNQ